ncbi:ligase [Aureococcus anophagefferens]|nr:ligase [Aureococcus anophagefferens]
MPSRWWRVAVIVATATAKVSEKARQHARNDQEEYANWRRLFRCEEGVVYEGFQPLTHALPGRLNLPRECDRLCATRPRCRVSNFLPSNGTGGDRVLVAWPPGVPDPLGGSRTDGEREVRLGLDPSDREIRVPGHNFALLEWTDGSVHVYGGRATSGATGVQHFSAPSVRARGRRRARAVVVRGTHGGCLEGRAAVLVCEWDGKLSAAVEPRGGRVALYGRLNTAKQHRWVQVAFAPAPAGPFGAFTPVSILGWGPCDVPFASVYYSAVNANPTDDATLLGLFPVNRGGRCVLGLAATCDGVHFGALEELLDLGCEIQGRTADYPVDGFLVDGDALAVFVHRDMPTEDIVKAGAERLAPRLVRHDVALDAVRALTRRAKADLATCATGAEFAPLPADAPTALRYPLCDDDAVSVPFSKLNTPAAFAEKQRAAAEARAAAAKGGR